MRSRRSLSLHWLVLVLLAAVATFPLWSGWELARMPERNDDWDHQLVLAEAQREAVMHYRAVPLWNVYPEGGSPLLANPESSAAYPLTWLTLPLPTQSGLRLQLVVHFLIGLLGVFRLCRMLELSPAAAAYGAVVFMGASIFPERVRAGHLMWMGMAWLPWVVQAGLEWTRRARGIAAMALTAQWLLGAHYLVIYSFVALGALRYQAQLRPGVITRWSLGLLVAASWLSSLLPVAWRPPLVLLPLLPLLIRQPRAMLREGQRLTFVVTLFALLSAVKLLPALELWDYSARFSVAEQLLPPGDGLWPSVARWAGWLARDPVEVHEDQPTFYHSLPILLALLGFAIRTGKARAFLLLMAVGWLWSLGPVSPLPVSSLAEALPVLSLVRYPARAAVLTVLTIAVAAGFGVGVLEERLERLTTGWGRGLARAGLYLFLFLSAWWMATASRDLYGGTFNAPLPPAKAYTTGFERLQCETAMYRAYLHHQGCVNGFTPVPSVNARHVHARGEPGYRGEAYLEGTDGTVTPIVWAPTRLVLKVEGDRPGGRLVLNQSYYPGWRLMEGGLTESWQGLLSTPLEPGRSTYVFEYRPWTAVAGGLVSLVALCGCLWAAFRRLKDF